LWFPWDFYKYRTKGSTGSASTRAVQSQEKVEGNCKDCDYKFKPKDLD